MSLEEIVAAVADDDLMAVRKPGDCLRLLLQRRPGVEISAKH
jgi:hypothetical protein